MFWDLKPLSFLALRETEREKEREREREKKKENTTKYKIRKYL